MKILKIKILNLYRRALRYIGNRLVAMAEEKFISFPLSSFSIMLQEFKHTSALVHQKAPDTSDIDRVETFYRPDALDLNRARLEHLESLQLPIQGKSVLDVGCGVGHLAQFFVGKGCQVFCVDGREENISSLRERYPGLKSAVVNIEKDSLSDYEMCDIVFCYGLLYHLENPSTALKNMSSVCKEILLLETCITDHARPLLQWVDETTAYSQSLTGIGSRPTPSYVITALLQAGFSYVYVPKSVPDYEDFRFSWRSDLSFLRDGHLLRQVFIASRSELTNDQLTLVGKIE